MSTTRWLHRLTTIFVVVTIAGILLTSLAPAGKTSAFLLMEGGESTDGETSDTDKFEFDSLELFVTQDIVEPSLLSESHGSRLAEETADTQITLFPVRLKRGPPLS